ncbi:MAG TPA: glucosyl-3-phosphoglycerate synthase, partial [Anaerolineae bacterium]|nr:glucosyl-3-phosphoglycerate synthase [Anaerolineae bacterium]
MKQTYQIMLPITQVDRAEVLLPLAMAWLHQMVAASKGMKGEIVLIGAVCVPKNQNLSVGAQNAQGLRAAMNSIRNRYTDLPLRVKAAVQVSYEPWQEVLQAIQAEEPDLILLDWNGDPAASIMGVPLAEVLSETPCELALVRPTDWNKIDRILLPIRGGPYTKLAVNFSLAAAEMANAEITVMYAGSRGHIDQPYASYLPLLRNIDRIKRHLTIVGDLVDEVLSQAEEHELIVMGASSRPGKIGPEPLGPIASRIATESSIGLVLVKSPRAFTPISTRPSSVPSSVPVLVDKWFAENTFDASEFDDIDRLIDLKRERNVSISLALPALNEEATVGKVIRTIRRALMKNHSLLDEIVLIDSGSDDRTREIAQRLGVPVYIHQEILPQYGAHTGKGEALWKSLHVTQGDLIAWIDTDIVNIHPRFVYGVIGPLLHSDRIQFVKGFYRRPLKVGDKMQAGGGGRVTELVARPLINLFFPELSGLIQPLSGEYAGWRSALEQVPFFTGYGVET